MSMVEKNVSEESKQNLTSRIWNNIKKPKVFVPLGAVLVVSGIGINAFIKYGFFTKNYNDLKFQSKNAKYIEKQFLMKNLGSKFWTYVTTGQKPNLYENIVEFRNGPDSIRAIYKIGERTIEDSLFIYDIPDEIQIIKKDGTTNKYFKKELLSEEEKRLKINDIGTNIYENANKYRFIVHAKQANSIREQAKFRVDAHKRMKKVNQLHKKHFSKNNYRKK